MRHGIAYAGGLAEAGGEGIERQRALVALCRETGFLLCGPNCVGVINTALPATSTFATALHELDALRPGVVSMVSQSGGIGTTSFAMAQQAGFGFRHLISSGNEAVVDFSDYLHALARDDGTEVIVGYLEGVQDGPKLVRALEEARRQRKPVVLIKAGRSPTTARAAEAHTGALVGEERVWDAVLQELGVIRVDSVEELIDTALMLVANHGRLPAGPGVGIVSFGGGSGVLAADQCTQHGLVDASAQRRGRRAAAAAAGLRGVGRQPARPHPDHRLSAGSAGQAARGAGRDRCGARDRFAAVHRELPRRAGGRDHGRHRQPSRNARPSPSA